MNQLLQEKRDAENFLRLIAPKYAAVYILDRSTDTFRDILAPEAFRAFAKDTKGSYSDAMQLYRDQYVACDYKEVIDRVLDYDYVYNILSSGNQVNVTYRKKDGTLIRLKIDRYSDNDENTSIWVYTNEDSEDALYGELGEARYRIRFDDNERPVEFVGSESLSEMLYGFKGETHISCSMLWNHMHPQDIDVVKEEFKNIHDTRDSTVTYEVEYRLQNKDKQYRWYRAIGKPVLNEKGKIVSVCGFLIDIHKHKEKNLLQQRFISGLSHEYVTVWVINHDLTVELYQQTKKGDHIAQEAIEKFAKENNYQKSMEKYASEYVCEEDREDFLRNVNYRVVRERIKTEKVYPVVFQRKFNGKIDYFQACFAQISEDTDDFVMGFKLVNDIVEHEKERNANGKAIQAIATIRTISETKRKELNLFFEAEQARREAKIKTRFLQSMSHDMRTPLNGIAGMLHIAEENPKDLELQKTTRNKVHQSLNYLISLVNDVLDMNDLESDNFTEEEVDFDITKLLGNMNIDAQQLAQEKNIQYVLDWYEGQLSHSNFRGYPIYLSRILMIVVQNAVKFTPENGEIHVWMNEKCLDDSTSLLEFRCKDNGIGMSQDFIKHAFDLFAQEDSSSRSTYQGTGLGLSIAKKLVEYMHGNIQLESEKGIGTTVSIQIPFKLGKSIENKNNRNQQISLEGLCVLVAEDNDLNMEIVEYMLERNGIQVVCAKDGQEVIDLFEKSEVNEFDFILMDIMMPKLNGLDATRKIRSLKRQDAKTVPIIAMSANAFVEDIMNSKIAGMNMHLAKPLDETKLIEALKQCKKDEDFK